MYRILYSILYFFIFFKGAEADIMKKKLIFSGAATALVTPLRHGEIDIDALDGLIERQIKGGISALVIGGTTGEAATLSDVERRDLYTHVKGRVRGRTKIIFGTGTNDTRLAIKHTRLADSIGTDGLLVVTPYYNKGTFSGVTEHYRRIAAETDIPIILYNVPSRTGVNLTVKQLEELSRVENIVGIKEASDSVDRLTELAGFGDELFLYAGNDTQIYATLALGGMGVISVLSNLYPEYISKICSDYFIGNRDAARRGQLDAFRLSRAMFIETNPSPIKYALSLAGICSSELRLPLSPPCDAARAEIEEELRAFKGLSDGTSL